MLNRVQRWFLPILVSRSSLASARMAAGPAPSNSEIYNCSAKARSLFFGLPSKGSRSTQLEVAIVLSKSKLQNEIGKLYDLSARKNSPFHRGVAEWGRLLVHEAGATA